MREYRCIFDSLPKSRQREIVEMTVTYNEGSTDNSTRPGVFLADLDEDFVRIMYNTMCNSNLELELDQVLTDEYGFTTFYKFANYGLAYCADAFEPIPKVTLKDLKKCKEGV